MANLYTYPQSHRRRTLLWDHQRRRLHSYCDLGEALLPRTVGGSSVRDNTGNLLYIKIKYCHRDRGVHSGHSILCARIRSKPSLLARRVISGDGQRALSRIFLDGSSTAFWLAPMLIQTTPGVNSSPEWIRRGGGAHGNRLNNDNITINDSPLDCHIFFVISSCLPPPAA
jgi:hypothetical protein